MLRLLGFIPCERIILSDRGLATIVNVLDRIDVNLGPDADPSTAVPFAWEIMTLWRNDDVANIGKSFEQRIEFERPDGQSILEMVNDIPVKEHLNIRLIGRIQAFPVGVAGTARLKLSIRDTGVSKEWTEVSSFPIEISHGLPESVQAPPVVKNIPTKVAIADVQVNIKD